MDEIAAKTAASFLSNLLRDALGWAWKGVDRWLHRDRSTEELLTMPHWLQRFRWWMISEPDERRTPRQWYYRNLVCPVEGHRFPRGLPNNEGRWHLGDDDWFGVCERCSCLFMASSEERLDEVEASGVRAWLGRRPKRRGQLVARQA